MLYYVALRLVTLCCIINEVCGKKYLHECIVRTVECIYALIRPRVGQVDSFSSQ